MKWFVEWAPATARDLRKLEGDPTLPPTLIGEDTASEAQPAFAANA
jgi:hypothetical protein